MSFLKSRKINAREINAANNFKNVKLMQQTISAPRNTCSKNFLQQLIDAAEYFCYIFSDLRVVVVVPMQLPGHDADCPNSFKFQKIRNVKMVRTWCTTTTSVSF